MTTARPADETFWRRYVPGISLFSNYKRSWWKPDTVTVMPATAMEATECFHLQRSHTRCGPTSPCWRRSRWRKYLGFLVPNDRLVVQDSQLWEPKRSQPEWPVWGRC